jgi:tRNA(Arg) A34 adenosine deaminase TadA
MNVRNITLNMPDWIRKLQVEADRPLGTDEERMRLAVRLARLNVDHGTGGPFGAAVFECESHRLLAVGVNLVVQSCCSAAHAEIVAISCAQQALGRSRLSSPGEAEYELVSSAEPCAMCLGAIPWAGIARLVCGARDEDARRAGFDEGEKPRPWDAGLRKRGIKVVPDVCRAEAAAVLEAYASAGGEIYGGGPLYRSETGS